MKHCIIPSVTVDRTPPSSAVKFKRSKTNNITCSTRGCRIARETGKARSCERFASATNGRVLRGFLSGRALPSIYPTRGPPESLARSCSNPRRHLAPRFVYPHVILGRHESGFPLDASGSSERKTKFEVRWRRVVLRHPIQTAPRTPQFSATWNYGLGRSRRVGRNRRGQAVGERRGVRWPWYENILFATRSAALMRTGPVTRDSFFLASNVGRWGHVDVILTALR